jgi:hypothetical protein
VSAGVEAKLLDNQIAGLDRETLLETIRTYGNGGRLPDEARFLWRATGLLEKHPELAWELLSLYRHPAATTQLQAKVLDLLASTGHEVAQAVMREALGDPAVLAEGGVAVRHLYQRFGLVREPATETAEMVAAHYRELRDSGNLEAEVTAAYALGAIAGKLSRGDDEARSLAAIYSAELARDLHGARDPAELAHRVTALGNARLAENVPVFSALARHESTRVRQRVAHALGRAASETPPPALLDLMSDEDRHVQREAIRVATPRDEVYLQLADEVSTGGVPQLNVRPILDLIKEGRRSHRDATTRLLDALLARGIDDDKDREVALMLRRM